MNTADRSIAAIDSALRRRFFIRDLRPEEVPMTDVLDQHLEQFAPDLKWMVKLLDRANELIGDPDQSIGPSHFLLGDELTEETARQAWKFTVMPTLREHFYGQSGRLDELTFDQLRAYALTGGVDAAVTGRPAVRRLAIDRLQLSIVRDAKRRHEALATSAAFIDFVDSVEKAA